MLSATRCIHKVEAVFLALRVPSLAGTRNPLSTKATATYVYRHRPPFSLFICRFLVRSFILRHYFHMFRCLPEYATYHPWDYYKTYYHQYGRRFCRERSPLGIFHRQCFGGNHHLSPVACVGNRTEWFHGVIGGTSVHSEQHPALDFTLCLRVRSTL